MSATILSSILGWREQSVFLLYRDFQLIPHKVVTVVLALYIGNDLDSVIGNPIGQPMATVSQSYSPLFLRIQLCQIFFNSVGKQGTLAIWAFMILTLWMTGMDYVRRLGFCNFVNPSECPSAHCRIAPTVRLFAGPRSAAVGLVVQY
jgi:hypothetical protein